MSQPYNRIYNFSAGPCTLPVEVLEQCREDLLNYKGTGMSVMEMSHRSKPFEAIIQAAEQDLRELLGVPENYKVLFLQGGASTQFAMVPTSFLGKDQVADFIITGAWGKKALESAKMLGSTHVSFDNKAENYKRVPALTELNPASGNVAFVHTTSNETIQGVQFQSDLSFTAPHVCDMSSDILSRPVDISKYDLVYAGAQKNMGPAGATVIIIKDEFLERAAPGLLPMMDYKIHSDNQSMYNTPPCWSIYVCGLVYKFLLKNGGLNASQERNAAKAKVIYDAIDHSGGFFKGHADVACRSSMNVTFTLPSDEVTSVFIKETEKHALDGLKGHRSVGGCRASIYNAFPIEGCQVLADVMKDFASKNA